MGEKFKQNSLEKSSLSIYVEEYFFDKIESGQKTVDIRTAYSKFHDIKPGSIIEFKTWKKSQKVSVKSVRRYQFIHEMLEKEDMRKTAPDLTLAEIEELNEDLFVREHVEQYGLIAIEFEKIGRVEEQPQAQEKSENTEVKDEAMLCPNCSTELIRYKACYKCTVCGYGECLMPPNSTFINEGSSGN